MSRLAEFGEPDKNTFQQDTLSELAGNLYTLLMQEIERAERTGGKIHGVGPIARRVDLVQYALDLLEEAQSI